LPQLAAFVDDVMTVLVVNLLCGHSALKHVKLAFELHVIASSTYLFHQWHIDLLLLAGLFGRWDIFAIFGEITLRIKTICIALSREICIGLAACSFPLMSYLSGCVAAAARC
jgi:hypothetical protein